MIRRFNPTSEHPARAVQAWEILVSKAMNRQTVTYELLSALMYGKKAQGVLNAVLGHVAFYCEDNGLPPLLYLSLENGLENLEKVSLLTPPKLTKIVSGCSNLIGTTSIRPLRRGYLLHTEITRPA
ncbi:MAG: hypothetical protein DMG41_38590 [Acidobacteria bacterium]|nr:MAG: hypothetical protein DMG41_38590 [Acidobacteriota bacterium]HKN34745.1 hypothetical protein [Terriglobales bacterium]